ncbi:MAG: hypothetical protein ABFS45_09925 [Pseudomonadota bacterium]
MASAISLGAEEDSSVGAATQQALSVFTLTESAKGRWRGHAPVVGTGCAGAQDAPYGACRGFAGVTGLQTHVKGHGGLKSTVRRVYDQLPGYRFVLRTDVKGYYESIDHLLLMAQPAEHMKDKFTLNLLWQYLHRLYEQQKTAPAGAVILGDYVRRWWRWVRSGLSGIRVGLG